MEAEEGVDPRWMEAAMECIDFDLNVSSELSEERSDEDSNDILKEESDESCITIPIGCNLDQGVLEEGEDSKGEESGTDKVLVMTEVIEDPEGELEGKENSSLAGVDNFTSAEQGGKRVG